MIAGPRKGPRSRGTLPPVVLDRHGDVIDADPDLPVAIQAQLFERLLARSSETKR